MQDTTILSKEQTGNSLHPQPGELYKETFDQILTGFVAALNMKDGNVDLVSLATIESVSDVDPNMLEMYYKNTRAILNEVVSAMKTIVSQATANAANTDTQSAIRSFLQSISSQPMMLKTLQASHTTSFWKNHLIEFVKQIARSWPESSEETWSELYAIFCFQLEQILVRWQNSNYATTQIPELTQQIYAWVLADGEYMRYLQGLKEGDAYRDRKTTIRIYK